jgi:hypothetical protein
MLSVLQGCVRLRNADISNQKSGNMQHEQRQDSYSSDLKRARGSAISFCIRHIEQPVGSAFSASMPSCSSIRSFTSVSL